MPRKRGGDVESALAQSADALRIVLEIACALRAEVERGVVVGVRRDLRREIGVQQLTPSESRRLEGLRRQWNRAAQIVGESREIDDVPVRSRKHAIITRNDQNVRVRCEEDFVRGEVLVECGEHLRRESVVELIKVQPLSEDASVGEVRAHTTIELCREEARDATNPGVGRFGENEIETSAARGEIRLRVVEYKVSARILEYAPVGRIERARGVDHFRLDLDRREVPYVGAPEQKVRGHA